jgi:hypothetical protein
LGASWHRNSFSLAPPSLNIHFSAFLSHYFIQKKCFLATLPMGLFGRGCSQRRF